MKDSMLCRVKLSSGLYHWAFRACYSLLNPKALQPQKPQTPKRNKRIIREKYVYLMKTNFFEFFSDLI